MQRKVDKIFLNKKVKKFEFDEKVVPVFQDMILRSVPGYENLIKNISIITKKNLAKNSMIYDLGCSLGACARKIADEAQSEKIKIVAIDNSEQMINYCHENYSNYKNITFIHEDINNFKLETASVVILNFTLQFIKRDLKDQLIAKIFNALDEKGILVISEKVISESKEEELFLQDYHEFFKSCNGYTKEEIDRKKLSLSNVMLLDNIKTHERRFKDVGFSDSCLWHRSYNFVSWIVRK